MYKNLFKNKKAVFFDLDGTLVDNEGLWFVAMNKVMTRNGGTEMTEDHFFGVPLVVSWEKILEKGWLQTKTTINDLVRETYTEFINLLQTTPIEATPGFWPLALELKQNKKMKLALVTGSPRHVTDKILGKLGISKTFDFTICGDEVKNSKPSPDIYLEAAKKLGVKPRDVVAFEDSTTGAQSSVDAGIDTIIIWNSVKYKEDYPSKVKDFVPDFTPIVGNLDISYEDLVEEFKKTTQRKSTKEN